MIEYEGVFSAPTNCGVPGDANELKKSTAGGLSIPRNHLSLANSYRAVLASVSAFAAVLGGLRGPILLVQFLAPYQTLLDLMWPY